MTPKKESSQPVALPNSHSCFLANFEPLWVFVLLVLLCLLQFRQELLIRFLLRKVGVML